MQHEDMLTKLDAAFQSGDAPDIYMERGGGELADHVEAGLTKDISESAKDVIETVGGSVAGWQVDGKTYALPFSVGVVGLLVQQGPLREGRHHQRRRPRGRAERGGRQAQGGRHRADLGRRRRQVAGRPLLVLLRAARVLASRCSRTPSRASTSPTRASSRPARTSRSCIATKPFNKGFLSTPAQTGPTSASGLLATGKVAMEMQGHWEPGVMQGLTEDKKGLGDNTGWFPFPAVTGGAGRPRGRPRRR